MRKLFAKKKTIFKKNTFKKITRLSRSLIAKDNAQRSLINPKKDMEVGILIE